MYVSPAEIREAVQVDENLMILSPREGQSKSQRLDEVLVQFSRYATRLIDRDRGRSFLDESGNVIEEFEDVKLIATRLCSNMVNKMLEQQNAKHVKREDYSIRVPATTIMTKDIYDDLQLLPTGPSQSGVDQIGFHRIRRLSEIQASAVSVDTSEELLVFP